MSYQKNENAEEIKKNREKKLLDNMSKIKHKIIVMSGKGGVGKSTISINIAYGLSLIGKKVGLLDADLHGPNVPIMLGIEGTKLPDLDKPFQVTENLKVMSLSFYSKNSDDPIILKGPLKTIAIHQMLGDVKWGELDYFIVDLPSGTGDESLTIAQSLGEIDGSIIVTTPQKVALLDSRKSVKFSEKVNIPIFGIIENMSGFICPNCGAKINIFKVGGGEKAANELGVNFLGKIPLTPEIVDAGDNGTPYIFLNQSGIASRAFHSIVNDLIQKVEV